MRIEMHLEEIRHLFAQHAPEIVRIAAAWPKDESGAPLPSPENGVMTPEFEQALVAVILPEPERRNKPHEKFQYGTRRPDRRPPDAKSSRQGPVREIPGALVAHNPSLPEYDTPLAVNLQFDPENPFTPHLDVDVNRVELGQPGVAQEKKSAPRYASGRSAGLTGIANTGGRIRTERCFDCPNGGCADCPGDNPDIPMNSMAAPTQPATKLPSDIPVVPAEYRLKGKSRGRNEHEADATTLQAGTIDTRTGLASAGQFQAPLHDHTKGYDEQVTIQGYLSDDELEEVAGPIEESKPATKPKSNKRKS